ncbi:unknown [Clostridium sp. CAG:524]|nr:unknown [Clostridium sp. CAG:524]
MVNDGKKVIPYIVPDVRKIEIDITMMPEFVEEKRNGKREIDYTKMRVYELKRLLNLRFNTYKVSRGARNELENRGVLLKKKYKRVNKVELEEE